MSRGAIPSMLLKPARDLAQNWSIDVAAELETYLNQVEDFKYSQDDSISDDADHHQNRLNFIEAALLLQSGTSVYSKKVEYLRALTYETLNHFSSTGTTTDTHRQTANGRSTVGSRRVGTNIDDWDISESFFVPWNAVIQQKKDIEEPQHESAHPIHSTPYILNGPNSITKHVIQNQIIKQQKQQQLTCDVIKIPLILIPRDDRNEYRLASFYIDPSTGILLANPNTSMESESFSSVSRPLSTPAFPSSSQPLTHTPGHPIEPVTTPGSYLFHPSGVDTNDMGDEGDSTGYQSKHLPEGVGNEEYKFNEGAFQCPSSDFVSNQGTVTDTYSTVKKKKSRFLGNPLLPLDCHKQLGRDRPQKVGQTFKAPDLNIYLCSIDTLSSKQYQVFNRIQQGSQLIRTHIEMNENTEIQSDKSMLTDNNGFHDKLNVSLLTQKDKRLSIPDRIPEFNDLKYPTFVLQDHFHLGSEWLLLESEFLRMQRSRQTSYKDSILSTNDTQHIFGSRDGKSSYSHFSPVHQTHDNTEFDAVYIDNGEDDVQTTTDDLKEHDNIHSNQTHIDIENALLEAQLSYSDVLEQHFSLTDSQGTNHSDTIDIFHAEQAQLHQRMAKWRQQVECWLSVINTRQSFDVSQYKELLAEKIECYKDESVKEKTIPFSRMVDGSSRADVCRLFLTSLLMCNEGLLNINPHTNTSILPNHNQVTDNTTHQDFQILLTTPVDTIRALQLTNGEETQTIQHIKGRRQRR